MLTILVAMTGIMAGIYFTFSVFVMRSLAKLPALEGAKAMNTINEEIVKTVFLPIFFISSVWYTGVLAWSFTTQEGLKLFLMSAAAVTYILGMFTTTVFGNVPLNEQLKASANKSNALLPCWEHYQRNWTHLNHIRTVSCIAAMVLLSASLLCDPIY